MGILGRYMPDGRLHARGRVLPAPAGLRPVWLCVFVLACIAGMGLGQGLRLIPDVSITFWPPSGIFVAALLLSPRRAWPAWALAAFTAEMIGNAVWFRNPIPLAALYYTANAAEALTAATLVRRVLAGRTKVFSPRLLTTPRGAALFALLAAGVAPVVGATVIASVDALTGKHGFWTAWTMVWLGDATGLLLSAPIALGAVALWRGRGRVPVAAALEVGGACAAVAALAWLAVHGQPLAFYLTLPVLVWCAVRFQIPGAWAVLSALVLSIAVFARPGAGWLAAPNTDAWRAIVALQVFLGVSAVASLLVAGLSARHRRACDRLRSANTRLERRVLKRTRELRASEERFKTMANAAPAILWVTAPDAAATFLSSGWHEFTGQSPAESLGADGLGWLAAVHPDDRDGAAREFLAANRERRAFSIDYRVRRADGEYRWAVDSGRPRFDERGGFLGYVGSVTDVHERVEAQAATRRIAETFASLVERSPLGIYTVDADFKIRHVSQGARPALRNVEPVVGRDFAETVGIMWPEPVAAEIVAIFRRTLETGEPYVSPGLTGTRRDLGSSESYEWQTIRAVLDDGRPGVVCYFFDSTRLAEARDVIARHAAELDAALAERTREVRRAEKALATSERMAAVGTLAAGLAHDMTNLLLPLRMRLDDLNSGRPLRPEAPPPAIPEEVREELLVLSALLEHLRALARNLSLFSRDPSKEGVEGRVRLADWCGQVSKLMNATVGPGIAVTWDCGGPLPEAAIAPHRLTQAVQNLVHNARDAVLSRRAAERAGAGGAGAGAGGGGQACGKIAVAARAGGDGRFVELSVADDGAGMSEEVLLHCREPFYTTKDRPALAGSPSGGSGLGLSLAHQIVERVGGELLINSTLGQGTTITLRIPVAPPLTPPPPALTPPPAPGIAEPKPSLRPVVRPTAIGTPIGPPRGNA